MAVAAIGAIAGIASAVAGIATSVVSSQQASDQADLQKAALKKQEAERVRDEIRKARLTAGSTIAKFGKSGAAITGTPLDVLGEIEANQIENLRRISDSFRFQEMGIDQQLASAQAAGISSVLGSAGDLVGSASFFDDPGKGKKKDSGSFDENDVGFDTDPFFGSVA